MQPDPSTTPFMECDACHRRFSPRGAALGEYPRMDGSVLVEMRCPHCDARYPCASISAHGLKIREEMNREGTTEERRAVLLKRYRREVKGLSGKVKGVRA